MAKRKTEAWETSGSGYVTFDTSVLKAAVRVARDPNTSEVDRRDYAKQVNRNAHSTYISIRNRRKQG